MRTETFQIAQVNAAGERAARLFVEIHDDGSVGYYAHITKAGEVVAEAACPAGDPDVDPTTLRNATLSTATPEDEEEALLNIVETWDALGDHYGWDISGTFGVRDQYAFFS